MGMEYFPCYHSYRKKIAKLSDQEVGRLFRSLLEYSETGESPELTGRESVAFDFIADDIDRAKNNYSDLCDRNRKNVNKRYDRIPSNTTVYETYQSKSESENKSKNEEDKEKSKRKKSFSPPTQEPFSEFSPEMQEALQEWMQYKAERKEQYKPTGLKAFVSEVRNKLLLFPERAVITLIRECMANGWRGIIWDRLEKQNPPVKKQSGSGNPFLDMVRDGVCDDR